MLLSEIEALHARMFRTGADDVELDIAEDMPHDFLSLRPNWVWEPKVTRTFERISGWLDHKVSRGLLQAGRGWDLADAIGAVLAPLEQVRQGYDRI